MAEPYGPQGRPGYPPGPTPPTGSRPGYGTAGSPPQPYPTPPPAFPNAPGPSSVPKAVAGPPAQQAPAAPQRPAQVTVAISLGVTGSMVWMTGLAIVWLFAESLRQSLDYRTEGAIYYMVERFHLKLVEGLVWPLFGFPLAAVVSGFLLLLRRPWPRIVFSALGAVSLLVTVLMMRGNLQLMWPGIVYICFTCLLLWSPGVSRWCSWGSGGPGPSVQSGAPSGGGPPGIR